MGSRRNLAVALAILATFGESPEASSGQRGAAGQAAREQPSREALTESVSRLEDAIARFRAAGDAAAEANAQIDLADAFQRLSDNRRALAAYEAALALYRGRTDEAGVVTALMGLGATHGRLSNFQLAIDVYSQALPLVRARGDRKSEATALTGIAGAQLRLNRYREARDILNQALPIFRALGDRAGEASALALVGTASFSQDDFAPALASFDQALALARATGQRGLEASVVQRLGQTYYHLGDYQRALDLYNDALDAYRTLANRSGEAVVLGSLGRVYQFLGDYPKALEHLGQSRSILRASGEQLNEATALNNMGHVYLAMGEYRQARPLFEESLEISRRVSNEAGVASNTNGIGLTHAGLGEYERALPFHHEALRLFRSIGHRRAEGDSFGHIGRAYLGLGRYDDARTHLLEALAAYRAMRVPRSESEVLFAIARTERAAGNLAEAESRIDAAIALAEGFRRDLASQPLRTTYLAAVRDRYALKIDVLMQQYARAPQSDAQARAFETSERARARSLLDLLAEARTDIRVGVDPALLERERVLAERLASRAEKQTQLLAARGALEEREAIARALEADLAEAQEIQAKIRASSPRYAALMRPEPLALREIQTQVLDGDTVLLEYFLGAERSYVWAVTEDAITGHELPKRSEIEAAASRFYDLAKANGGGREVQEAARALSDLILQPVAGTITRKRLAIVADGALHYVPFAALPEPAPPQGPRLDQPLIVQREIVSLPSASTLAVLRDESKGRALAPKLLAVVADPVFDASDVRVRRSTSSERQRVERQSTVATPAVKAPEHTPLARSVDEIGMGQVRWPLPRLLGTRREAREILSLAPASATWRALDFDASRETATTGDLGAYQVLHFATHALINNQHPELSGLVLSLVDRDGRPRDGFLRLNDIYNLRLPAELVVLSACQTGLGKEISGEGLIGLTRGFMYAGAPRLITSLWQVDDKATSELMTRFYRGLFGSQPLGAAAALRQAQIEMWRQKDWQSLYYWAGFSMQGEWQDAGRLGGRVTSGAQ